MGRKAPSRVVALLALDDTDTRQGGCTTHAAHRIACALQEARGPLSTWGLLAPPRLVRLCPAIRDKTRGNGALVLPIGPTATTGGVAVGATPGGDALLVRPPARAGETPEPAAVVALAALVAAHLPAPAHPPDDPQPAALLLPAPPGHALYEEAVVRRLGRDEAWARAPAQTTRLTPPGRRGEIGAIAAAAWRPRPETMTWEAIGYRTGPEPERRLPAGFAEQAAALPGGFDNVDAATGRVRAVPRTPCPVRFGLRGTDPVALSAFANDTDAADGDGWWLVATNHARGDTLVHAARHLAPERVVRVPVRVAADPERRRGGHVFVDVADDTGRAFCLAAYEPTRAFAGTVARLRPGDRIEAYGRTAERPDVVALEAFRVLEQAPRLSPGANPRCPCGTAMKSRGAAAGYRCRHCGTTAPREAKPSIAWSARDLAPGTWHQVPDHVRGHLLPPPGGLPPAQSFPGAPVEPVPAPVVSV